MGVGSGIKLFQEEGLNNARGFLTPMTLRELIARENYYLIRINFVLFSELLCEGQGRLKVSRYHKKEYNKKPRKLIT